MNRIQRISYINPRLQNRPQNTPDDAIDEIIADGVNVTIKQHDRHTIVVQLRETGAAHQFRFVSNSGGKGAGICLRAMDDDPPGARINATAAPDEIAAYNLRQGGIRIEMMDWSRYRIRIITNQRAGSLQAAARSPKDSIVLVSS